MKTLLFTTFLALTFLSCSKSPESAAAEVCDCYKSLGDAKMAEVITETKECTQLAEKYRKEFSGDDLKAFSGGIADCVTGGLFK